MMNRLPPVGNRLSTSGSASALPEFPGYKAAWLASGTQALALAMRLSKLRRPAVEKPSVILPAYGCPDLVAAAVFAGVTPVLVDIQPSDPGYCLESLAGALNESVVAVVAVNFLGVREHLTAIRTVMADSSADAALIEDNAQWFPEDYLNEQPTGAAEFCLTSFGRGKPVNLMGGGCLLVRNDLVDEAAELSSYCPSFSEQAKSSAAFIVKGALFNAILHPLLFHWVCKLPGLNVGATEYHKLEALEPMGLDTLVQVGANVKRHLLAPREMEAQLSSMLNRCEGVNALPVTLSDRAGRLLRYPVLVSEPKAKVLRASSIAINLGLSPMYAQPLIHIPGVKKLVQGDTQPLGAMAFSSKLITLPVHAGVTLRHVRQIEKLLE